MTVISLAIARRKRKLANELYVVMDTLLDQLRAVCIIPAEKGERVLRMTEKERLEILRLDRKYHDALTAISGKRKR